MWKQQVQSKKECCSERLSSDSLLCPAHFDDFDCLVLSMIRFQSMKRLLLLQEDQNLMIVKVFSLSVAVRLVLI
jgi:hypothetical protein